MRLTPGCPVIASLSRHPYSLACNALYVILRSCIATTWESPGREPYYKTHARYFCTCVEKRRTQAKEWALSPPIMWFQKHSVRRAEGYPCYCPISHKIRICRSIALFNDSVRRIVLCHSEEQSDVRIAGNGHLVKKRYALPIMRLPFREIATALQATSRNDISASHAME